MRKNTNPWEEMLLPIIALGAILTAVYIIDSLGY